MQKELGTTRDTLDQLYIMCVMIHSSDKDIHTLGDLREVMPDVIWHGGYLPKAGDDLLCLCGVDVVATALANGREVEFDSGDYVLKPKQ